MMTRELFSFNKAAPVSIEKGGNPILTFQDEMNKLFAHFFGETAFPNWENNGKSFAIRTAVDIREGDKSFAISAEVPGMDIKDIHITAKDGYLTIRGEKKEEVVKECDGCFRQERSYGEFQRVIALPDTANLDGAKAEVDKGVLNIIIPKKAGAESRERRIEINQTKGNA
jgi:HSP20 family protein